MHVFIHEFISKGNRPGRGVCIARLNQLGGRVVVAVARNLLKPLRLFMGRVCIIKLAEYP